MVFRSQGKWGQGGKRKKEQHAAWINREPRDRKMKTIISTKQQKREEGLIGSG